MASKVLEIFKEKPCELPLSRLPRIIDAIKAIYFYSEQSIVLSKAISIVAEQIYELWQRVGIPTISVARINVKLTDLRKNFIKNKFDTKNSTVYMKF